MSRAQVLASSSVKSNRQHSTPISPSREQGSRVIRQGRFAASCLEVRRTLESSGYVLR